MFITNDRTRGVVEGDTNCPGESQVHTDCTLESPILGPPQGLDFLCLWWDSPALVGIKNVTGEYSAQPELTALELSTAY